MGMAAVIYKKGAPDNFVWEEIKVGTPGRGQVRLRSTAVGVNFADTYHRAGIAHPMIVGDPPVVLGFEGVGEIEGWVFVDSLSAADQAGKIEPAEFLVLEGLNNPLIGDLAAPGRVRT